MSATITQGEGTIAFNVPSAAKECFTWYKIVGTLDPESSKANIKPLVVLHGGPGLSHDYLTCLAKLNEEYGIPVIFYDQIGGGRSTHLPEHKYPTRFFIAQLFINELYNLLRTLGLSESGYDLLGHSWGGMLAATWAGTTSRGLRKLVLANAPSDVAEWAKTNNRYLDGMPESISNTIRKCEKAGDFDSKEYQEAMGHFHKKHSFAIPRALPQAYLDTFEFVRKDDTVVMTMTGPSEFAIKGSLDGFSTVRNAKNIKVPTLIINGANEICTDEAIKPFLERIDHVKWVKFEKSTHSPMYEEPRRFFEVVSEFLLEN